MTTRLEHPGVEGRSPAPQRGRTLIVASGLALIVLVALVVFLLQGHQKRGTARTRTSLEADRALGRRIEITTVKSTPSPRTLTLPGDVHGYSQTTLYAKLSGYVREMRVDRGDHVRRGQVLAVIESPESEKDVLIAENDARIAAINAHRAVNALPSGVVSKQDHDNAVAQALVTQSTLERTRAILAYTAIRAPFDGTVTARYTDPGALVPAATGGTQTALPLVDVTDIETLRIFVYVGQDAAPFVHTGDGASLWQDEVPAKRIPATVSRSTNSLDPRTRTMQVEIDLDNRAWGLLPGTFAHVELRVAEPASPVIPDEAILIRDGRTMVARIHDGHAHMLPVDLGYNDGRFVRVLRGLTGGEIVGMDVPVEIADGDPVQPSAAPGSP